MTISKSFRLFFIIAAILTVSTGCGPSPRNTASEAPVQSPAATVPASPEVTPASPSAEPTAKPSPVPEKTQESPAPGQKSPAPAPVPAPASAEKVQEAEKLYEQGFQIYLTRKYTDAIKYFDMAIKADPACYKAYNGKGIALCFKGDYKNGMDLINKALEIKSDYAYANFNMALAYKLRKDFKQSLVWFDKTLSYDPKNTWSYFGKACIYAEWNDAPKALENLRKAIETDSGVKDAARNERDLDSLRNNPDFINLLK